MIGEEVIAVYGDAGDGEELFEVQKLVRCRECKHWVYNFNGCARNPCTEPWYATDFCNYGEREGE